VSVMLYLENATESEKAVFVIPLILPYNTLIICNIRKLLLIVMRFFIKFVFYYKLG